MKKTVFRFKWLICLYLQAAVLLSCSNKSPRPEPGKLKNISLHEVRQFRIIPPSGAYFGRLRTDFKANYANDRLAFYDESQLQIIITDTLGRVKTILNKKGRGPGELVRVDAFAFSEKGDLFVYDNQQAEVMQFDPDGNFLDSFLTPPGEYVSTGRFIESVNDHIYFPTLESKYSGDYRNAEASAQIVELDKNGEFVSAFGRYDSLTSKTNGYMIFPVLMYSNADKRFYTVQTEGFIIQGWDLSTHKRVYTTQLKPPAFSISKERISPYLARDEIKKKYTDVSIVSALYTAYNYIIMHFETMTESWFATSDPDKKGQHIALYDKEGRLVGEKKLDYRLAGVANNRLYLILDDNPDNYTLGVYDLEVD